MRVILYIVILAIAFFVPVNRLDIAKLQPVEAVAIYKENGFIVLKTDEESVGKGTSAKVALEELKQSTPAVVYLDTADYLLIGEGAKEAAEEIKAFFKKSVKIGTYQGGDVKEEARYLDVHGNAAKPSN